MLTSTRVTLNHAVQVSIKLIISYMRFKNFLFLLLITLLDAILFFCTHLIVDLLRDFEDFLTFVGFLFNERILDATLLFCTHLIDDLLRDFEDFLAFVGFLSTERLLDATLLFCIHLIVDLLRDFEDFLAFVGFLCTERLLDATLFFCTRLIDDLLLDFEDFFNFKLRLFEDTLFFCCLFIDIRLTHRLFRDLVFLLFFLNADLLLIAVLRLIVAFLIIRAPVLFFKYFEETAVFLTEALLHIFFFIVPRDFNKGTLDVVLLHLLFTLLTILL